MPVPAGVAAAFGVVDAEAGLSCGSRVSTPQRSFASWTRRPGRWLCGWQAGRVGGVGGWPRPVWAGCPGPRRRGGRSSRPGPHAAGRVRRVRAGTACSRRGRSPRSPAASIGSASRSSRRANPTRGTTSPGGVCRPRYRFTGASDVTVPVRSGSMLVVSSHQAGQKSCRFAATEAVSVAPLTPIWHLPVLPRCRSTAGPHTATRCRRSGTRNRRSHRQPGRRPRPPTGPHPFRPPHRTVRHPRGELDQPAADEPTHHTRSTTNQRVGSRRGSGAGRSTRGWAGTSAERIAMTTASVRSAAPSLR